MITLFVAVVTTEETLGLRLQLFKDSQLQGPRGELEMKGPHILFAAFESVKIKSELT